MSTPVWPVEHVDALRQHIEVGHYSAGQAMVALNEFFRTGYSRNAVIGKCKRADPPIRMANGKGGRIGPKGGPSQRKPKARAPTLWLRKDVVARKAAERQRFPAVQLMPQCEPLPPGTVSLLDLASDGCRYPSGDGPFLFCGAPQLEDMPYCASHCRIAYRSPEPRRAA